MSAPFRIYGPAKGLVKVAKGDNEDDYYGKLVKMIPGEVLGLYLVGSNLIPKNQKTGLIIWAVVCLVAVVASRYRGTADPKPNWAQILLASLAFVIWVYTLGGPFAAFNLHIPYIGSLLVLAYTFFVPLFYEGPPKGQ